MKYEVYIYFDPRIPYNIIIDGNEYNCKPVYVGKGNISQNRKIKHKKINENTKKSKLVNLIKHLYKNNIEPIIISVFQTNLEYEAFNKEMELIKNIGREDIKTGPLFNLTNGGEGQSGKKYTKIELLEKSKKTKLFWESLSKDERKKIGKKSASNRTKENIINGAKKQKITKSSFSKEKKKEIEEKRFLKWAKTYYSRGEKEKKQTSKKCSIASYKKPMYYINYLENNIEKNSWLLDMTKQGYARDGIMYRIKGKVDINKPFKSRTTGNVIQILNYEKRNDYLFSNS